MIIIENVGNLILSKFRANNKVPYDTGNLLGSVTNLGSLTSKSVMFEVGGQNAPYAEILQENAKIRGYVNTHYQFIDKILDEVVPAVAKELGGYSI